MKDKPFLMLIPLLLIGVPVAMLVSADWSSIFSNSEGALTAAIPGPAGATADEGSTAGDAWRVAGDGWNAETRVAPPGNRQPPLLPGRSEDHSECHDLADILRFDITAAWILGRWKCVSVGLAQLDLEGYRVPVVTGAGEDDVAGALTYYFSSRQQVQRITFSGTTGDPDKLIRLLAARFHFGRHLTKDPGLFRYEVAEPHGPPKSHLEIRLAWPSQPAQRFDVSLAIERPKE